MKKRIFRCSQHQAKAISSGNDEYQEEMISLKHKLHRNNYLECITSVPRNLNRRRENENSKLTTEYLPHVRGLAERIENLCSPYDIRTVFTRDSSLRRYLFRVKPPREFNMTKNWVYSISCSCGKECKCVICCPLKVRLEHQKAVVHGEFQKLGMVDHIGKEKRRLPLWDEVKIIDRKEHRGIRRLKESAHTLVYSDLLSRPSLEKNAI